MRYGVINAMPEEMAALVEAMDDDKQSTIAGKVFHHGKIGQVDVVVVESGIGKVAAAITTTLLITNFAVDAVINSGSAGALGADLRIGDVVVARELAYADADARAFGYDYGQVPQQPATFVADQELSTGLATVYEDGTDARLIRGLIVTSDSFIASADQKSVILANFPDAQSAEMEGAAIAQVAHYFDVPFAVVRAISDNANGEAGPTFDEFIVDAGKQSAQVLIDYFKQL
jgi:adenosylhomocysteine nucleosidase